MWAGVVALLRFITISQIPEQSRRDANSTHHPAFKLLELAFPSQQFLSLLIDLTLYLDFDLPKLLLFAPELFLLQTHALASQALWVEETFVANAASTPCAVSRRCNRFGQLLGTVVFVEEVVGDLLQVCQMRVEESGADGKEVAVAWIVDLDSSPRVLAGCY
jgi:hypothetical protein